MFNSKFKVAGIFLFALFSGQACVPVEETMDNTRTNSSSYKNYGTQYTDESDEPKNESITLNYTNQSSGIEIKLDPEQDEFFMELSGMKPAKKDTVIIADSTLMKQRLEDIQEVLSKFRQAQDLFYLDEYTEALRLLNETLEIAETADAYALKGTIHYMLGNSSATKQNWNKAVALNPDFPIPNIPELENLIEDLKLEEQQKQEEADTQDEGEQQ